VANEEVVTKLADPGKIPEYTAVFTSLSQVATNGVVPSTKTVEAMIIFVLVRQGA
jgi:hypothetical protein